MPDAALVRRVSTYLPGFCGAMLLCSSTFLVDPLRRLSDTFLEALPHN
jgi:hypothetical protein